ncbi:MAG: DNA cytosine methyltransferase [Patescibacteria group bacterium]
MAKQLRAIDFFCGAGGWSEGLRQQGIKVVMGIDNWRPAVETHNINHGLNDVVGDVLSLEGDVDATIEKLPDTEIIVGSPPCISFSMSNKAGKADKSLGIRLIEAYLRFVAVKKHKKRSILQAWYMENVPNSRNFVQKTYTFADLNLSAWAKKNGKNPKAVALNVQDNGGILCAADYGSPQSRERFVCGEMTKRNGSVKVGEFLAPKVTNANSRVTLEDIKGKMPKPTEKPGNKAWADPNYPNLKLKVQDITDHFYDPGVYRSEWESAKAAKVNHPFMGRMSFPEDRKRPSRTIMATRSGSTREAIIYPSEWGHVGDGQYRLPTIREAASLMGFPITYQFTGGEGSKWRQIGNAVCPHMSAAIGAALRKAFGMRPIPVAKIMFDAKHVKDERILNLNTFAPRSYDKPPLRKAGAKFRRQPFKSGNMTVALMNFDPRVSIGAAVASDWRAVVFVGAGKVYDTVELGLDDLRVLETSLASRKEGRTFIAEFEKKFDGKVAPTAELQTIFETNQPGTKALAPSELVQAVADLAEKVGSGPAPVTNPIMTRVRKAEVPHQQLLAMYALARISAEIKRAAAVPEPA